MLHPDGSFFGEIIVLQLTHTGVEAVFSLRTNTFALPQLSPEVRIAEPPNGASQAGITGSRASAAELLCTWRVEPDALGNLAECFHRIYDSKIPHWISDRLPSYSHVDAKHIRGRISPFCGLRELCQVASEAIVLQSNTSFPPDEALDELLVPAPNRHCGRHA